MKDNSNTQDKHRRDFIGTLAAGAAALGLSTLASPLNLEASPVINADANQLEAWFAKAKGKHKIVFDATRPHEVFPFAWPRVFLITNENTGTPAAESSVIVVLRHSAIGYAFQDSLWEKYKMGELFEAQDHLTKAPAVRNPFWKPKEGDFSVPGLGNVAIGINELQASGVMFCVCEVAMTVYSAIVADKMKKDAKEIRSEWMAGLLPGIQPVPSGVWAVGRAQEHGCSYCFAG